jgi:hypothetical protein
MKKINFSTFINTPIEHTWSTMLDDETYRIWTNEFQAGSYYKGDWSKGSRIMFLGPNPINGTEGGIVADVAENRLYEYVLLAYKGIITNGVEDMESEEAQRWNKSSESYTFTEKEGGTELLVELEIEEQYADMFTEMWPRALEKLKEISEK